ncbi:MAG: ABC transporter substrate-binding protein [Gemmatimonadaceae bacterium]|nr:ABC transporter substrate-binding protein [Acetobacteraceae bacterium]
MTPTRRTLLFSAAAALTPWPGAAQRDAQTDPLLALDWADILLRARGQTVFFNAWAGDDRTNAFIAWAGAQVRARFAIDVTHVRLRDTAEAVARVVAEKAAGRAEGGSVDVIWINGPNFLAMKEQGLLFGPVLDRLPHARLVDRAGKPSTVIDFTVPVDGLAIPWRMAQVVFVHDSDRVGAPPRSIPAILDWARANPGRTTHPNVRNFMGVTFLKQALYELAPDPAALLRPVTDETLRPAADALWTWYDALRPHLWRRGAQFPETGPAQRPLMMDGEIDLFITFNPSEASSAIATGQLPGSARSYVLDRGTIGNTSFVAIPFNAANKAAAMVLSDFLLGPEAQAHAQDPRVLGNFTVLDPAALDAADRARFDALPRGAATPSAAELGRPLLEPHPSWMNRITAEWERRYAR